MTKSMYQEFATDKTKEAEGVVVDFGMFRTKVKRAGGANKAYAKTMELITQPYRRVIQLGVMAEGKMRELLVEGYAKAIVLGWEYMDEVPADDGLGEPTMTWKSGIELTDGTIGEPTWENIKDVLIAQPDIFDMIKEVADNLRNYKSDDDEAARKN